VAGSSAGELVAGLLSGLHGLINVQEYGAAVNEASPAGLDLKVETVGEVTSRAVQLHQRDAALGTVVENRILTAPGGPEKRHIGTCININHRYISD
jgi:hypothetical protein